MLSVLRSSAAPEDALAGALETVRLTDDAVELDSTTHAIARSAATAREAQSAHSAQLPPQSRSVPACSTSATASSGVFV